MHYTGTSCPTVKSSSPQEESGIPRKCYHHCKTPNVVIHYVADISYFIPKKTLNGDEMVKPDENDRIIRIIGTMRRIIITTREHSRAESCCSVRSVNKGLSSIVAGGVWFSDFKGWRIQHRCLIRCCMLRKHGTRVTVRLIQRLIQIAGSEFCIGLSLSWTGSNSLYTLVVYHTQKEGVWDKQIELPR